MKKITTTIFTAAVLGLTILVCQSPRSTAAAQSPVNSFEIVHFHDLKQAPTGQAYILWAVSPDNQFTKLGQIANFAGKNEAEIKANTTLDDFGLLVTMENLAAVKTVIVPVGLPGRSPRRSTPDSTPTN